MWAVPLLTSFLKMLAAWFSIIMNQKWVIVMLDCLSNWLRRSMEINKENQKGKVKNIWNPCLLACSEAVSISILWKVPIKHCTLEYSINLAGSHNDLRKLVLCLILYFQLNLKCYVLSFITGFLECLTLDSQILAKWKGVRWNKQSYMLFENEHSLQSEKNLQDQNSDIFMTSGSHELIKVLFLIFEPWNTKYTLDLFHHTNAGLKRNMIIVSTVALE